MHAGEILREEFMKPLNLSISRLARDLHVSISRISHIVKERRAVTPDTALRLGRYFSNSPEFWINLQVAYDLDIARHNAMSIEHDIRPLRTSSPVTTTRLAQNIPDGVPPQRTMKRMKRISGS
jgi:addiction module HigA family antidote